MKHLIKIKQTGGAAHAGFQSMGDDHMRRIGAKTARQLCGMYPLPEMGYETLVAFTRDAGFPSFAHRLGVQNISGCYFVACSSYAVDQWPEVFKVQIV